MASAAGNSLIHIAHGGFTDNSFIGEQLGVTVFAGIGLGMERMAEAGRCDALEIENDFFWFHPLVAAVAVAGNGKDFLAVMATAAGAAFLHLGHGYGFPLAGEILTIVTAFARFPQLGNMSGMAEDRLACPFQFVSNIPRLAFVAKDAILFRCDAEGFYATVAGSAGFGFFHLCHG